MSHTFHQSLSIRKRRHQYLSASHSPLSAVSVAMSQFRALVGALRGGRAGGSWWLRGSAGGRSRRYVDPSRGCSSEAVPSAVASSSSYVEEMYFAWLEDHKSVHKVTSVR